MNEHSQILLFDEIWMDLSKDDLFFQEYSICLKTGHA